MDPNRRIAQPGPALEPRVLAVPCDAVRRDFDLAPGRTLLDSIAEACEGRDAVLELEGGALDLAYVIPALSKTPSHAAYYSERIHPEGATVIEAARVTFGRRAGAPWLHAHGFWRLPDGRRHGGHILPDESFVTAPIRATAWLLHGAGFDAEPDPETGFTLFGPVPREPARPDGACLAVRLRPNQDLGAALTALTGNQSADIRGGVASIIGAVFADGAIAPNFATEMFIRTGHVGPEGIDLDVALVDCTGALHEGGLKRDANPVLMTAELVLERS